MKMTKTVIAAAATLGLGCSAPAHATVMTFGAGGMNCGKSLSIDWTSAGITAWVEGYMTAQEGWVSQTGGKAVNFLPHGKNSTHIAGLVLKECRANPSLSINDAAAFVAAHLIARFDNDALD